MANVLWHRNPDRSVTADEPRYWENDLAGGDLHADVTVSASGGYDSLAGWTTAATESAPSTKYIAGIEDASRGGLGFRYNKTANPAADTVIAALVDGAGAIQACAVQETDGTITLWRGNMSALLATSSSALSNATYKLGFFAEIDGNVGSIEVQIDGETFVRVNGVDTDGGAGEWRGILVGFSNDWIISHLYVVQENLIPGYYVATLGPDATGTHGEEVAVSGAATIHDAIDETDPNDDTDFVKFPASVGARFDVSVATLSDTLAVYGVLTVAMPRNIIDSGMSASHEPLVVVDGQDYADDWQSMVTDEWRVAYWMLTTNPATGLPWTVSEINAATFGGRLQA